MGTTGCNLGQSYYCNITQEICDPVQNCPVARFQVEKTTYLNCFCDFSHGAKIRTESGRFLGATCFPGEAENIIRTYFQETEFPEPVHVYFGGEIGRDGVLGYTFSPAQQG
jgi:hypothetical protein